MHQISELTGAEKILPHNLLNAPDPVPDEFYIFVNNAIPITAHNFHLTGTFVSAGAATSTFSPESLAQYLNGELNFVPYYPRPLDGLALSPFFVSATSEYSVEYDADYWRDVINPLYPSRLSAIYAFGDLDSCVEVSRKYGWPLGTVKRFQIRPWPHNRVVRVNMEVVSLMRLAKRVSSMMDVEQIWRHYWGGQGNLQIELPEPGTNRVIRDSGVIWEYLIDGTVQVIT